MNRESVSEQFAGNNRDIGKKVEKDLSSQKELDETPWYKRHLFYWMDRRDVGERLKSDREQYASIVREVEQRADEIRAEAEHYHHALQVYSETQDQLAQITGVEKNPVNVNEFIDEADRISDQLDYRGHKKKLGSEGMLSQEVGNIAAIQDFFFPEAKDTVVNVHHPQSEETGEDPTARKLINILSGPEGSMVAMPHSRIPRLSMSQDLPSALSRSESQELPHLLRVSVNLEGRYSTIEQFDRFIPIRERDAQIFQQAGLGFFDGRASLDKKPAEGEEVNWWGLNVPPYSLNYEAKVFSREEARDQMSEKEVVLKYSVWDKGNAVSKEVNLADTEIERLKKKIMAVLRDDHIYSGESRGIVIEMGGVEIPYEQLFGKESE